MRPLLGRLAQGLRESREPLLVFAVTRGALFLLAYLSLAVLPLNPDPERRDPGRRPVAGIPRQPVARRLGPVGRRLVPPHRDPRLRRPARRARRPAEPRVLPPLSPDHAAREPHRAWTRWRPASWSRTWRFLAALLLLHRMARARFGADAAFRCVVLLSVFPFSFYFSAVYSESLFLLLAVGLPVPRGAGPMGRPPRSARSSAAPRGPPGWPSRPRSGSSTSSAIRFDLRKLRPDVLWLGLSVLGPFLFYAYLGRRSSATPGSRSRRRGSPGWWQGGFTLKPVERALRTHALAREPRGPGSSRGSST